MKAILFLPKARDAAFFENLIDRPFLTHIVEFMADQGVTRILLTGPDTAQAKRLLGTGSQWDVSIEYDAAGSAAEDQDGESYLIASAACLPKFPLRDYADGKRGLVVYGQDGFTWTGWAIVRPADLAFEAVTQASLERLPDCGSVSATQEFRCAGAIDLWKAHQEALSSNLSGLFHSGLETKPGIWIGRNASIAADAEITAPAYIGANSRIASGAKIGPFASIAADCLISARTIVRQTAVGPETYVGNDLELDHVLANGRRLFDIRLGVSLDHVDVSILDSVFDFHWLALPRRAYEAVLSRLSERKRGRPSSGVAA